MKKWDTKYGRDEFVPPLGLDHVAKTAEELQKLSAAMQGAAADSYLRDGGLQAAGGGAGSAAAPQASMPPQLWPQPRRDGRRGRSGSCDNSVSTCSASYRCSSTGSKKGARAWQP